MPITLPGIGRAGRATMGGGAGLLSWGVADAAELGGPAGRAAAR
ncbi:MAG TPA: hypothetical protein VJA85_03920 [Candidatus Limnocylindria bacterium]|nr:hypothetical protein [Candidatus Limnocylindria bacterium]